MHVIDISSINFIKNGKIIDYFADHNEVSFKINLFEIY